MEQARVTEFEFKLGATIYVYTLDEIVAFESSDKYTEVILNRGTRRPIMTDSLVTLEKIYADLFVRCHRGALVRRDAIRSLVRPLGTSVYDVHLNSGHVSPVSRREKATIRAIAKQNELNRGLAAQAKKEEAACATQ